MSIRIAGDNNFSTAVQNLPSAGARNFAADGSPVTAQVQSPSSSDLADISSASELFSLARSVGGAARDAKVSNLSLQFSTGQYRIDPAKLSRAIVDSCLKN